MPFANSIHSFFPDVMVQRLAAPCLFLLLALVLAWRYYGRIGNVEFPKEIRFQASFPGSAPLLFSTDSPTKFHYLIGRADIQKSVLNLLVAERVDHLRSIVIPSFQFAAPNG
jgi:hypothetical protein